MTQPPQIADSPLVAAPKLDDWQRGFTGAGVLDSATSAANNVRNFDPTALGVDAVGMGMDGLGLLTDPFNALIAAGIGWIIEHIGPVKEAFDGLMGDPDRIDAAAQTWDNIGGRLGETAEAYRASLSQVDSWQGGAADAYRAKAGEVAGHFAAAAGGTAGVAHAVRVAGTCVAVTRTIVLDLLSELVATLIEWGLAAAAAAVPTVGGSVAAFIARAVTKAVEVGAKIMQFLSKLFRVLDELGTLTSSLGRSLGELGGSAATIGRTLGRAAEGVGSGISAVGRTMSDATQAAGRSLAESAAVAGDAVTAAGQGGTDVVSSGVDSVREGLRATVTDRLQGAADSITGARTPEVDVPVHTGHGYGIPQYRNVELPPVPIGRIAEETLTKGVLDGGTPHFGDLTAVGKEAVKETHERFGEDDGGEDQAQTSRQR